MSNSNIKIDLVRDWRAFLHNELSVAGYSDLPSADEEIDFMYFNLLKRMIESSPREVLKSSDFKCPSELENVLIEIEKKTEHGEDLTPYLSRKLKSKSYNDLLLNDWGIHHLHLGKVYESDGYVSRSGPLLFARFDHDRAYFINVIPHDSWALQDIVRTLHENWPESISQFRIKGVTRLNRSISDSDVAALRKGHITSVVEITEGIVYAPIGGGISTSGLSIEVVKQADIARETLRTMEKWVKENISKIVDAAAEQNIFFLTQLEFGLEVTGGIAYAVEINTMLAVKLGPL